MFKNEEEKLSEYKKGYDGINLPLDSIDDQIRAGFLKAKQEKVRKPRKNMLILVAMVAIILVGFMSSIKILDYIRDNKGLLGAVEHDYYQEVGASVKKNGVEVVIDGAIADEHGIVIFYTIHSDETRDQMRIDEVELTSIAGGDLGQSSGSYGMPISNKKGSSFSGMIEYFFKAPVTLKELKLEMEVIDAMYLEEFSIPFTLKEEILNKKKYELNKTVTIEGQKVTVIDATVYPLRVAIHVKKDAANTKKLLSFDDLRLVDENGETWGKIANGITASHISEDEEIIYLQSNYFRKPKELYLAFNKIQAVDKDERLVVVDYQNEEILQQPEGNLLSTVRVEESYLVFTMDSEEENVNFYFSNVLNEAGEILQSNAEYSNFRDGISERGIQLFDLNKQKGPIPLGIAGYPKWITGDEKIRVK